MALASLPVGSAAISATPMKSSRNRSTLEKDSQLHDKETQLGAALVFTAPLTALAEDGAGVALKVKGSSNRHPAAWATGSVFFSPAEAPLADENRDSYVPRVSWQSPKEVSPVMDEQAKN